MNLLRPFLKIFDINHILKILILLGSFISVLSFVEGGHAQCPTGNLVEVSAIELPLLIDDGSFSSLIKAVDTSARYLETQNPDRLYQVGKRNFSVFWLRKSIAAFKLMLSSLSAAEVDKQMRERFLFFAVPGTGKEEDSSKMLVTGYYVPEVAGSMVKKAPYLYPLYQVPEDLEIQYGANCSGGKRVGMMKNNRLIPYWTRKDIEEGDLLAGQELVYLKDPVDAFFLHIQGSGRIRMVDGTLKRVQYAADNGRKYRSIGRFLVQKKVLSLEEVTMPAIKKILYQYPNEQRRIFNYNQRYIFFKWQDEGKDGATGSLGFPLVPERSVALDYQCYPPGALGFMITTRPVFTGSRVSEWLPLKRFVFNHDQGSAIKGADRLDYFWGTGEYAENAAGVMKQQGRLLLLILKKQ
jgi:membrane-bound lytic murein transglycosylase A